MADDQPKNKFLQGLAGAAKAVGDKAKEIDDKLHIREKTKNAAEKVAEKTKEVDDKFKISEKTKNAANTVKTKTMEAAEKLKKPKGDDAGKEDDQI